MLKHYLDTSVRINPINLTEEARELGALEKALNLADNQQPVPRHVKTLRQLRKTSQTISLSS